MELLNIGFVLLIVKLAFCFFPILFGFYLLKCNEERIREIRNSFCKAIFKVQNAIPSKKFKCVVVWIATSSILFGAFSTWFLILRPYVL